MNRMFKIASVMLALVMVLVALPVAMAAENTHVLDVTTDLEALSASAENAGKEIVVGDYFTVILGEKTKIDSSSKTFDDGYAASQRLNFQHKTKADDNGVILPAVKFTTSAAATVKLWWVEGGDDNRQFAILNEAGEEVVRTAETLGKNDLCISELKLEAAGTYYLGTPDGSNYLFKLEVTEAAEEIPETTAPVAESKTITIGDKTFTAEKWLYNTAVEAADAPNYGMIIFDKNYTGEVAINGWGAAIVLDKNGVLVKIYDAANMGFWTVDGKSADALTFSASDYSTVAFNELLEGETLILFANDGGANGNVARAWALGLRNVGGQCYCGQTAELTGFTFGEDVDKTGDMTFVVIFVMLASAAALVGLAQKKRAF